VEDEVGWAGVGFLGALGVPCAPEPRIPPGLPYLPTREAGEKRGRSAKRFTEGAPRVASVDTIRLVI